MHSSRSDDLSIERRVRKPVKGLRLRLRTALRKAGVTGKFRTDVYRSGPLAVIADAPMVLPFNTFDGREIRMVLR